MEIEQYPLIYTKREKEPHCHTMGNVQQEVGADKIFVMIPAKTKAGITPTLRDYFAAQLGVI